MRLKTLLVALLFMAAATVSAQTSTPTATATATPCTAGVDVGNLNFGGNCQTSSLDADTKSDIYKNMATAAANVSRLPDEIRAAGPGGVSALPSQNGASQLFGYAKWVFSSASAQELLGKSLAPIGEQLMTFLILTITLVALYFLVRVIRLVIKAVVWIVNQILKMIPFW